MRIRGTKIPIPTQKRCLISVSLSIAMWIPASMEQAILWFESHVDSREKPGVLKKPGFLPGFSAADWAECSVEALDFPNVLLRRQRLSEWRRKASVPARRTG